jgi:hypothetical protein
MEQNEKYGDKFPLALLKYLREAVALEANLPKPPTHPRPMDAEKDDELDAALERARKAAHNPDAFAKLLPRSTDIHMLPEEVTKAAKGGK